MIGKKRGATQRKATRSKRLIPHWLLSIVVFLALSFVGAIVFLWHPWQKAPQVTGDSEHSPLVNENDQAIDKKKQFEFYDLLPMQQVTPVPTHAPTETPSTPASTSVTDAIDNALDSPDQSNDSTKHISAGKYILQINSFKTAEEADKLRADVMLLGIDADIQVSVTGENDVWYRLFAGPFKTRSDATLAQKRLQNSSIDSIVVEQAIEPTNNEPAHADAPSKPTEKNDTDKTP